MFAFSRTHHAKARFLRKSDYIMVQTSERAVATRYRKSQLDASVFLSAFQTALNASPMSLAPNETLVILNGGTPESIVAGLVAGYRQVIYISDGQQQYSMMGLPTAEEERSCNINYSRFQSVNAEDPMQGVLAAHMITKLTSAMRNHLQKNIGSIGSLKLAPPSDARLPPLRVYEFWAVTGQIQCRTVDPEADLMKKELQKAAQEKKASKKESPASEEPVGEVANRPKRKRASLTKPKADEASKPEAEADGDAEEEEDDEEADDLEAALQTLENKEVKPQPKPKAAKGRKSLKGK